MTTDSNRGATESNGLGGAMRLPIPIFKPLPAGIVVHEGNDESDWLAFDEAQRATDKRYE